MIENGLIPFFPNTPKDENEFVKKFFVEVRVLENESIGLFSKALCNHSLTWCRLQKSAIFAHVRNRWSMDFGLKLQKLQELNGMMFLLCKSLRMP